MNQVHYFFPKYFWNELSCERVPLVGWHTSSKYGIRCNFLSSPKSILVPWSLVRQSPSFDWFSHCSPKTSNCNYSEVIFSTSLHNCIMYCIWYHSLCTIIEACQFLAASWSEIYWTKTWQKEALDWKAINCWKKILIGNRFFFFGNWVHFISKISFKGKALVRSKNLLRLRSR